MNTSARWQFAVEVFPENWKFPAGKTWVAGWIWAGEHHLATDVRVWIDGRAFWGIHGLPKPGWDEKFLGRPGPPYSGFVALLSPHRGARLLRLEVRDPAGAWTEIFSAPITVDPEAALCPLVPPLGAGLAEALPALLRRQRAQPAQALDSLADDVVAAALSEPLNALPVPPFFGALEEPRAAGWLRYGRLSIIGWLAHRTTRIKRITAMVDPLQDGPLRHGLPRTDIGEVFGDLPGGDHSQFVGHVALPVGQGSPALLKVFAELDNGEKHLAFAQRFTPRVISGADMPLPPLSRRSFARALLALHRAARRRAQPVGEISPLVEAIKIAWAHYRAEAPLTRKLRPLHPTTAAHGRTGPLRIVVATHNLNFEGAPWFIFELARYLAAQPGITVHVVSPHEGPMRRVFAEAGMPVDVLDLKSAFAATSPAEFQNRLKTAGASLNWKNVDLLVANTMVSFWAVHLARAAGTPSMLYVHESAAIRRFFEPILPPPLFPLVEDAFRRAGRVVFTADSSRQVFDYLNGRGNFRLLPSWVDIDRIDAFASTHDKPGLRQKHGLDPDAVLIVNIGSICERKGQHIFVLTAALLQEELRFTYPGKTIQFVMVGARPSLYLDSLRQEAGLLGLQNALVLPETGEIFDFYRLADIFVCTSFEESFPRVLLESAAFRLPIVSTNVNGIAEMLAPDEAWLIPPGDRHQLGDAVKKALVAHFAGDTSRADRARAAVERRFHEAKSLPQHLALAREAARS